MGSQETRLLNQFLFRTFDAYVLLLIQMISQTKCTLLNRSVNIYIYICVLFICKLAFLMLQTVPTGGKQIPDLSNFKEKVGRCSHIAVYRPLLNMFHHYLVIEVNRNSIMIIHNIGYARMSLSSGGFGKILKEKIEFNTKKNNPNKLQSEHLDFDAGLYLIEGSEYPTTENQKDQVIQRASRRIGETGYKFSSNNCEWFVTWAITGKGRCEQIENAGQAKRVLADVADSTVCNYRTATLKTIIDKGVQSSIIVVEKAVASKILKGSSKLLVKTATTATSRIATGAVAAIGVVPVEAAACAFSINSLHNKMKDGQIDKRTFKREVTKKVSGSVGAAGAGIGGAVIGQILIPVPIVGGIVGGIIGGLIGRSSGSAISGAVYDNV